MPFKDMLKSLREERGLSQDELARLTQLSKSTISMYENGNREPKFETLEVIADFFNVDMNMSDYPFLYPATDPIIFPSFFYSSF